IRFLSNQNDINIFINYNKPLPSSFGFLDYLILNVRSRLVFKGPQMKFRDIISVGENNVGDFIIETSGEDIHIWEITEIYNIKSINSQKSGNNYSFQLETNTLREFIVFDNTEFYEPEILGKVENQNLHKPEELDMVIATHPNFLEQANQLADFHINNDELKTKVVTTEQVYNEFSSGNPDVAALRNYIKMIYDRESDPNKKIRYLLLFGDGSFDNKSMDKSNSNFILTYQSENSILYHKSFVSDDFFGLLDDNEGEADGYLDIGVGRFPVRSEQEARNMVNKVFKYSRNDNLGNWQNIICFVGDDEDGNTHMIDANNLATYIESNYKNYNIEKIYLDAFEQVTLSIGQSYPDVNQAINDKINKGVFIFNYSGHGGELGLAHERILDVNDIDSWDNIEKLPIFITATCEFSRFDDKNRTSAGEKVLLNANGGGIALLTTTRVVFSNSNYKLNESFYSYVFEKDSITKDYYRLGDIVSLAKRKLINDSNKRNFTLLGDPAIKLKYPTYHIVTDSINNKPVSIFSDTLKALSKVIIHGHVENESQQKIDGFQGVIYPTIFDKPKVIKTLGNDGGSPFTFYTQENIVYKGKATIKNDGEFKFEFIIPKDILYEYGNGKISYYGHYNELIANGYFDDLLIGGTSDQIINDTIGPDIILYFNNENFVYGGFTNEDPVLLAILVDSSGINTVGNAIGHDITAILDSNTQKIYVLNDFYESEIDQYQKGKIEYKLLNLEKGKHHLKLKAWDILNNSSQETIEFIVSESAELAINRIFNYPNPFTDNTAFYFEHNQPFNEIDVIIQIFTVSGKLVKTIETTVNPSGFLIGPINWDGYDDFGDKIGRGVYIYRVKLRSFNNKIVE
ncbi:MAG: type IX secretion system sortase PorU, partial [Bacteroidales bacterium]|nr:type IX secretion system sortase PorU [Bacteroidales bacterium]